MIIAKLIHNIWATKKFETLNGYKLTLVEDLYSKKRIVAVDTIGAGIGDKVVITLGSSARKILGDKNIPVDAIVVGIIDDDCKF